MLPELYGLKWRHNLRKTTEVIAAGTRVILDGYTQRRHKEVYYFKAFTQYLFSIDLGWCLTENMLYKINYTYFHSRLSFIYFLVEFESIESHRGTIPYNLQ